MQKYKVYINKECKIIVDNWDAFCANHTLIEAAGGLVYNNENQVLMIFRNGFWDLPKGKLESGESIQDCALREVEEECGVSNLEILSDPKITYHTYKMNGKAMLKRTYWFNMYTNYKGVPVPQLEEGITRVKWFSEQDLMLKIENSYMSIRDLFLDKKW